MENGNDPRWAILMWVVIAVMVLGVAAIYSDFQYKMRTVDIVEKGLICVPQGT